MLDIPRCGPFHGALAMSQVSDPEENGSDYESTPLSRQEYISAIVHLYRGELYRATSWRIRLDNTTNWAVLTTAGLLSVSFGATSHSHVVLLVGMALISVFWAFEARRYRFADIWYSRVRKIEENFYGPILRRDPVSPMRDWGRLVAEDLFEPRFKITRMEALRTRFLRNYWAIFLVLFLAWMAKVLIHPRAVETWADVRANLTLGPLPWWTPLGVLGLFAGWVLALLFATRQTQAEEPDHWNISP